MTRVTPSGGWNRKQPCVASVFYMIFGYTNLVPLVDQTPITVNTMGICWWISMDNIDNVAAQTVAMHKFPTNSTYTGHAWQGVSRTVESQP